MGSRLTWPEIRKIEAYRGRWIALDQCTYDSRTAQPIAGDVVDSDEDLAELCTRMQQSDNRHCAILYCGECVEEGAQSSRKPQVARRAYH